MKRPLTADECRVAREVFGDAIDLDLIRVNVGSWLSRLSPMTIGNVIHIRRVSGLDAWRPYLLHELVHAWQYQTTGWGYLVRVLWGYIRNLRIVWDGAYDWRSVRTAGIAWDQWGPDQQAQSVQDGERPFNKGERDGIESDDTGGRTES